MIVVPKHIENFNVDALKSIIDEFPGGRKMFCRFTDVSEAAVIKYVYGKSVPSQKTIWCMAGKLGIPEDYFSSDYDEESIDEIMENVRKSIRSDYEKYKIKRGVKRGEAMGIRKEFKWSDSEVPYPYNLVDAICKEHVDAVFTIDQCNGLEEVLKTLTEREQDVLDKRYRNYMSLGAVGKEYGLTLERIRQIEAKALRKLRHPSRMKFIRLGLTGLERYSELRMLEEEIEEKRKICVQLDDEIKELKRRVESVKECVNDCFELQEQEEELSYDKIGIEELDFSVRTYCCLRRSDVDTVGKLIKLAADQDKLFRIRNLGRKSVQEIYDRLWDMYHVDPRENGLEDGERLDNVG